MYKVPDTGASSSESEIELFQVFMGTGLWQVGADQQVFNCLSVPTFARSLPTFVVLQLVKL